MVRHLHRIAAAVAAIVGVATALGLAPAGVVVPTAMGQSSPYWANRHDPLTNASGDANGCILRVAFRADDGPSASEPGVMELQSRQMISCPASANVHRVVVRSGLAILHDDGTVEAVYPLELQRRGIHDEPYLGGAWGFSATPCEGATFGTHTYRARTAVRTWQTERAADDPDPFVARAKVIKTVTCEP
jgi:hypothetical protein